MLKLKDGMQLKVEGSKVVSSIINRNPYNNKLSAKAARTEVKANNLGGGGGARNSVNLANTGMGSHRFEKLLTGIMSEEDQDIMPYLRDIYNFDTVSGSAVDLISTLPFGDFTLSGYSSKIIDKYDSSIDRLNLKILLPELSVEYLVTGLYTSTLVFKDAEKIFTDSIPYKREDLTFTQLPLYGVDPLIRAKSSTEIKTLLQSQDPRMASFKNRLSPKFIEALTHAEFDLEPLVTLFIPRKTTPSSLGVSYLKRILPIYLLEKLLYRGTLTEAGKRQRSFLHIQAGDEDWEPTGEELTALVSLFQQAELDPLGAVIATRNAIQLGEQRQGGDFWKWTDITDVTTPMKLRALGINESFLSGETTFATAEVGLVVFLENLTAYRQMVTHKLFTNKLFPLIAVTNGFYKDKPEGDNTRLSRLEIQNRLNDTSKLIIPKVNWHKSLHPKNDNTLMDVLQSLTDKGIPIPLRMWAAAGGMSIETILQELSEEKDLKKRMQMIVGETPDEVAGPGSSEESSIKNPALLVSRKRIGLANRDFSSIDNEVTGVTKTGKTKAILNQKGAQEIANKNIAKAISSLTPDRRQDIKQKVQVRLGRIPKII